MRQLLGTLIFFMSLALFGLSASPAFAEESSEEITRQVEELSAQGAARFRAENYRAALVFFEEAYALQPVPNLLYNIARAYEELEEWDPAIEYFERFLTAPDADARARETAMNRIQSIRARQRGLTADDGPAPEAPDNPLKKPNRVPAFAAFGAGGALLFGGAVMGITASQSADQISDASLTYEQRLAARDQARTQALVADILYVSGAAAAAAGVYLFITSSRSADQPPQKARLFQPWLGPESAGFSFQVDF